MDIGLIGLGKMGGNMRERMRTRGHTVVGFDRNPDVSDVDSLEELVEALPSPKVVWVMVPAGEPTRADGQGARRAARRGRCRRRRRQLTLDRRPGARRAAGGEGHRLRRLRRLRRRLGPAERLRADGRRLEGRRRQGPAGLRRAQARGRVRLGARRQAVGAGHFAKMVHNGIEYAIMQAYAEGWELLRDGRRGRQRDRGVPLLARGHGDPVLAARPAGRRARRGRRAGRASAAMPRTPARAGGRSRRRSTTRSRSRRSPRRSSPASCPARTTARR